MNKDELKKYVCDYLDKHSSELIENGEKLLRMPELSYKEFETSAFVGEIFAALGLKEKTNLAITGRRADIDTGRKGPKVAVLGELDGLIVPNHKFVNPETHAAHGCGHHAALNAMLGCAKVLALPEVLKNLSGSLAFIATPSEECQNLPYITSLIDEGRLKFFGGKSELIAEGVFDDVDIALMAHAGTENFTVSGFNGFVMKRLVFKGKSAHAGAYPDLGVNAVSMMRAAMMLLDSQRDTFKDEDHVRIHGYIPYGGEAVNVVPDKTVFTLQVRGASPLAVEDASNKVDRCVRGAVTAFGGAAEVQNIFGFMPLINYPELDEIHRLNVGIIAPGVPFKTGIYRPSSTDMGDVSMLKPSLHLYFRGFEGTAHTDGFLVKDKKQAYVDSAKMLALNVIDLLYDDASCGSMIAELPIPMSKEKYLEQMQSFSSSIKFE